jgi:hypothetical protein
MRIRTWLLLSLSSGVLSMGVFGFVGTMHRPPPNRPYLGA